MHRFTISLDDQLVEEFDARIVAHGCANRSEAVGDRFPGELERASQQAGHGADCVANLSYVTQRHELDVTRRLAALHHDHDHRLETLVLKGKVEAVRRLAKQLYALRGVRHGKLTSSAPNGTHRRTATLMRWGLANRSVTRRRHICPCGRRIEAAQHRAALMTVKRGRAVAAHPLTTWR